MLTTVSKMSLWLVLFGLFSFTAHAADKQPYAELDPAIPTNNSDKVEVVDIFMYTCPHCYDFKLVFDPWKKGGHFPDYIDYHPLPAVFNQHQIAAAKAFYTAEAFGVLEQFHDKAFDVLHKENRPFKTQQDHNWIALVAEVAGVDEDKVSGTYKSFAIDNKVRQANELTIKYGISGTPTMIINGKYRFSASTTGSHQNTVELAKKLAAQEWQTMQAKKAVTTKDQ